MKGFDRLLEKLNFDAPDGRFELFETEAGEPYEALRERKERSEKAGNGSKTGKAGMKNAEKSGISRSVERNERRFRAFFNADENSDVIFRRVDTWAGRDALLIYMNGMADAKTVSDFVIRPLTEGNGAGRIRGRGALESSVQIAEQERESRFFKVAEAIIEGRTALFLDGERTALLLETRGFDSRSVTTAENERVVRGPQEGFTENLRTSVTLVRRIVKTADLVVCYRSAGGKNGTGLALLYRKGVANEKLIAEIEKRLEAGSAKGARIVSSSGMIEQLIEDAPFSPLPQTLATERPDRVASFLMNGAAAIIAEGSPFALIMPATAAALLNSPEDVYMRRPLGTLMRAVRYIGVFISLILPGYFVAVAMYHQGLLSTEVLSTLIKSREMVFEPLPFEMILLLFVFQLIREAGMRVPGSVGQAIGVIGGLILGQAAVSANLASTVILIIVALSGLGNLCIPDYSTQIAASYFRLGFVIAAWLGGLLALTGALVCFAAYMADLKSFGVPFLSPIAPKTFSKRPMLLRGGIGRGGGKGGKRSGAFDGSEYAEYGADDWLNTPHKGGKGRFGRRRA